MIAVLPTYRPTMRMSGSRVSYTACVARVAIGEEGRDVSTQLGHIITLVVMEAEDGRGRARGGEGGTLHRRRWRCGTRLGRTPSIASTSTPWSTRRSRVVRSPCSAALSNAISATACGDKTVIHCLSASRAHGAKGTRGHGAGARAGAGVSLQRGEADCGRGCGTRPAPSLVAGRRGRPCPGGGWSLLCWSCTLRSPTRSRPSVERREGGRRGEGRWEAAQ